MYRTHTCDQLTKKHEGKEVTLSGWVHNRRDHGGVIFIDLRDMYGLTQVTFRPDKNKESWEDAYKLRSEDVIRIEGKVVARPKDMVNSKLDTGEIEVIVEKFDVLSKSKALPFEIDKEQNVNEDLRLKYRFIDLRRERMKENLLYRSKVIKFIRDWFYHNGFHEFETPILTSSSPEGARDYLVPSRIHPGKFYALPQAPQQYKQLLMVSGFDQYFQIAPCFRDEDPRADRSPGEFYQLDVEVAFRTQEEFFAMMEPFFKDLTEKMSTKKILKYPLPQITYEQAMLEYGTDKPDLRYEMKIQDVSEFVGNCGFKIFTDTIKNKGVVRCLVAKGAADFPRSTIDKLTEFVQERGAKGLAYIIVKQEGVKSPILKFIGEELADKLVKHVNAQIGDIVFFGADQKSIVEKVLGELRVELANRLNLIDNSIMAWAWVVDFPMFEYNEELEKIDFGHNPFSFPQGGMNSLKNQDPLSIKAFQYDIICNGFEISSGAVRNYDPKILYKAFEIAGYKKDVVKEKFSAMLSAFEYGAPPTCGFAPGIERMIMLLRDEPNIREITAFPKNGKAEDVMMSAPSEVDAGQLKELHIKITK